MKEAFWGVLIVMLGLFGIVVVNLFQKVTIENDRVYYVIKESTEASMYDAVDLSTYRLTGKLRMVEDKFVENLTRRFAQNVSLGNYTITVQDINETPPYVSVVVKSSVTSIKGDAFTISNSVNGILETKYTLDELLDFLDITEDEWNNIQKGEDKNVCDMSNIGESECIPGDLKFGGFEDIMVESTTCLNDSGKQNVAATAKYAECECGKWVEKEETVYASGVKNTGDITYKWTFTKDGELRNINEIMTRKSKLDVCTTGVQVMVPKDLREKEPSTDNSQYVACPAEGIRIPSEQVIVLHGGYIPDNATNRVLEWTKDGNAFTMASTKNYVSKSSYSRAIVTVKKVEKGETASNIATATTTLKQAGTCKVNTWDGAMEKFWCNDLELNVGTSKVIESGYEPYNANKTEFEYSVSDTSVVNIEGNNLIPYKEGKVVLTIKDIYTGNSNTCNLTVKYNFTNLNVEYTNSENYSLYKVYDNKGEVVLTTNNYSDAKAKYDELDPGEPLYDDEKSTTPKITIPNGKFEKMLEWKGTMDNGDEFGCNSYGGGCTNITEVREAEAAAAARVNGSGSGWVDVNYTGWSQSSGYSVVTSLPLICAHPCI